MSGHFQNGGVVKPSLDFWRELSIECLDNKIGVELGYNKKLKEFVKFQYTSIVRKLQWNTMAGCAIRSKKGKKGNKNIKSAVRTIPDGVKIPGSILIFPMVYYYDIYALNIIKFRL